MIDRRWLIGGAAATLGLAAVGGLAVLRSRSEGDGGRPGEGAPSCDPPLTRGDVESSIALGAAYLRAAQKFDGDFVYEVDWRTGVESREDNAVRQAGAAWGLALVNLDRPDPALTSALDLALRFWLGQARSAEGRTWFVFRDDETGALGTVALVALTLCDRLRAPGDLDAAVRDQYQAALDGAIAHILAARMEDGGFRDAFDLTGRIGGLSNPYADGECLLLLARVGRHLNRPDLLDRAVAMADQDYQRNVVAPRSAERDPDRTKGYYQWGSMSWYELAEAGREPAKYGGWLVDLAHWMIDEHDTLRRMRNTAYAHEGIACAYAWANKNGDPVSARKFACAGHQGLRKLYSWQIGHPLALPQLAEADAKFRGAVQNHAMESLLRIDVTQHQVHASLLAHKFGITDVT